MIDGYDGLTVVQNPADGDAVTIQRSNNEEEGMEVVGESTTLSEGEIISYVRTQIATYKCPKSIKFINELPRNPSGKILRRELRDPYWEGIDRKVSGN